MSEYHRACIVCINSHHQQQAAPDLPQYTLFRVSQAIGCKASLFHASEAGAWASAVIYSIVETAKANRLNVFQYLYLVLLYMPDYQNELAGISC